MQFLQSNIKFLRSNEGLSQEKFGSLFNLTRGMIDHYERATIPPVETLFTIAQYFKVSVDNLLTKDFNKNPSLLHTSTAILSDKKDSKREKELEDTIARLEKDNSYLKKQLDKALNFVKA